MEQHSKHKYIQYTGKKDTNLKSICFLKVIIYTIYLSTAVFPLYAQSYIPKYTKLVDLCTKLSTNRNSQEGQEQSEHHELHCCKALGFPFYDKKRETEHIRKTPAYITRLQIPDSRSGLGICKVIIILNCTCENKRSELQQSYSFPIKQSHPEHKPAPDLKLAFNAATQNSSRKGIHIKHSLQACKTAGNTASVRKTL